MNSTAKTTKTNMQPWKRFLALTEKRQCMLNLPCIIQLKWHQGNDSISFLLFFLMCSAINAKNLVLISCSLSELKAVLKKKHYWYSKAVSSNIRVIASIPYFYKYWHITSIMQVFLNIFSTQTLVPKSTLQDT